VGVSVLILAASLLMGDAPQDVAANGRLYLEVLIQGRDAWASSVQREIGKCETELRNRKHLSAKRGKKGPTRPSSEDPVRVLLGDGKWIDLADNVGRKEIEQVVAALKDKLQSIENGESIPQDRFWDPTIFNKFGRLGGEIHVVQVLGPSDMTIDIKHIGIQWITGFSTRNFADDQRVQIDGLFLVDGTKTYTTVLGASKTVRVFRPFVCDREKVIAEFQAQSRARAQAAQVAPTKPTVSPKPPQSPEAVAQKRLTALLNNSRSLIKAGLRDPAEKNLKRIIAEAPGTAIAAEAQKELDGLSK
jgi:hypothetical protein